MLKGAKGECNQVRQFGEFASQDAVTPKRSLIRSSPRCFSNKLTFSALLFE
jgi:hypothetical protein